MGFLETRDGPGMLPYADPYESPYGENEPVTTGWVMPPFTEEDEEEFLSKEEEEEEEEEKYPNLF